MNPADLITSLRENAELLRVELDDGTREEVVSVLRLLHGEAAAGRAQGVARALRRLTRALSVLPPGHPVCAHLGTRRYAIGGPTLPSAEETARTAGVTELIDILREPPPDPGELRRRARERLLAVPSLSGEEHDRLLGRAPDGGTPADGPPADGTAPGDGATDAPSPGRATPPGPAVPADGPAPGAPPPGVLRLNAPGGGPRYPRFQFRPGTAEPLPVVRRINELLRADRDPWGAADWWLGGNAWLAGVPADLLGRLPDDELVRAAAELVEAG
ncbi:hypothetical protein [Streptomyces sp. SHP 1-2]|uniref:hypothetical protein n=1 Tax=Streptomyces sp. SHP 1-2 TaxID=2769489 RepID=UPI002237428B|nr:hypothetical protein [Streptomyces sp. SHP 1-2]MCW5254300.1 hypothetical protein [Streptomyces sp. SHP 1-2]